MYENLAARIARAPDSPIFRRINKKRISTLLLHIGSQLSPGKVLSSREVANLALDDLEKAVANALRDFPAWSKPEVPLVRPDPVERLAEANRMTDEVEARKAASRASAQITPAERRAEIAKLPAAHKLDLANGDPMFQHLREKK